MSDTPRTDAMVSGNSNPSADEYEDLAAFTRQLERQLAKIRNEALEEAAQACGFLSGRSYEYDMGRLGSAGAIRALKTPCP